MANRYQDVYPESPLLDSARLSRPSAADLLTLEYFEAEPGEMPAEVFAQHHILLNLHDKPQRVENFRDGELRDFIFHKDEIVVTPAGMRSGWRWYERSKVIVITLEPEKLERFAHGEVGTILTAKQLWEHPQFTDSDLCRAGIQLMEALASRAVGSEVIFESLARVFLVKLIRKYGERHDEAPDFSSGINARQYRRVLDFVAAHYERSIAVDEMADVVSLSPSHFSRLFKQTLGRSPHQFVMSYRVEQAKKALSDLELPLAAIASRCGFSDQAHFSRMFKQIEGMTPRAYRLGLPSSV